MSNVLLGVILFFVITNLLVSIFRKHQAADMERLSSVLREVKNFKVLVGSLTASIKDDFQRQRLESGEATKLSNSALGEALVSFGSKFTADVGTMNTLLREKFGDFEKYQDRANKGAADSVREVKSAIEMQLTRIREDNNKQLDEMRSTVDEKLQKTINSRLSQSFATVSKQLISVQEGLGEMRSIAEDVGGLKRVLSNVKLRGGVGEVQLAMLLDQVLAPVQYEANVQPNPDTSDIVEFAVKLPGREDDGSHIWLPIDAKFPKDKYAQLLDAYDTGDSSIVERARKDMAITIKVMAKDISGKYLNPPHTTDFGIMFLPFEGIYAEVVRDVALIEELQRKYKVIVTGPTTLAAILNSLQLGFKTLAIEKRSSDVWRVLGEVKTEFANFEKVMGKAQKSIQTGLKHMEDAVGTRTRAINRRLRDVATDSGEIEEIEAPAEEATVVDAATPAQLFVEKV